VKGSLNHLQYNVLTPEVTLPFYKELLGYFEMKTLMEFPNFLGIGDDNFSLWLMPPNDGERKPWDRDGQGLNHLGIHVESRESVDQFYEDSMTPHVFKPAFETPPAPPDFSPTSYQVMFVDPEGLAIEVYHAHPATEAKA